MQFKCLRWGNRSMSDSSSDTNSIHSTHEVGKENTKRQNMVKCLIVFFIKILSI